MVAENIFIQARKARSKYSILLQKKVNSFAFSQNWDDQVEINLAGNEKVKDITFLGYNEKINWVVEGNKLKIEVPKLTIDEIPCTEAWTLKIQLDDK